MSKLKEREMKSQKNKAQKAKKYYKDQAIIFVKAWMESDLARYIEPSRAGTPKGQPIGLSRKKYTTSLLMVLHPTLKLKEIAELAGVSEGVLKVWQTQGPFKQAASLGCVAVGLLFSETIAAIMLENSPIVKIDSAVSENELTKWFSLGIKKLSTDPIDIATSIVKLLPFLNPLASDQVIKSIEKHFNILDPGHVEIALTAQHIPLRKWKRGPEVLRLTKTIITRAITHLVENRAGVDEEEMREATKGLNEFICEEIDFLAS